MKTTTELAEALFMDMVNGDHALSVSEVEEMALSAFAFASTFNRKAQQYVEEITPTTYRLKGCRACHGSGGKHSDPCKVCGGTGKIQDK